MVPKPNILLDLTPRFRAAYGFVPVMKPQVMQLAGSEYANFHQAEVYVTGNLHFEELTLKNKQSDIELKFGGYRLSKSGDTADYYAPPPMLGFHKAKDAIITKINGEEDSNEIVELYNGGAWEVKMQGLIIDMVNHHFPLDKLELLDKMFRVAAGFEVTSEIMAALRITNVWFPDVEVNPLQGFQDTIQFSLSARSTKPAEFFLNGEDEL